MGEYSQDMRRNKADLRAAAERVAQKRGLKLSNFRYKAEYARFLSYYDATGKLQRDEKSAS